MSTPSAMVFACAVSALLAWGALAFGGEYVWVYVPLLVFAVCLGVAGIIAGRGKAQPAIGLRWALVAIVAAALVQVAPLPARAVESVSPGIAATDYTGLYGTALMRSEHPTRTSLDSVTRPLSIAPDRSLLGLFFLAAFALFLVGSTQIVGAFGPHYLARGVLGLGLLVALIELAQKASGSDALYGFWYPPYLKGYHSAPFVNRNHTAGWLLMALPLCVGYLAATIATAPRSRSQTWRDRMLWVSSAAATRTVFTGLAAMTMAIAIVVTASRSGTLGLAAAILLLTGAVLRRQASSRRRMLWAAYLACIVIAAASWGRVDTVLARYEHVPNDVRPAIWYDALRMIRDSPLTGTGLNTFGIAMLHYQTVPEPSLYIEAHNDYLQVAAEGGLLLGIPILVTLGLFVREVRRRFREGADDVATYWIRVGAVVGLCAIALQETVDFTLQMPGAAVLFVVLAAIAVHRPDHLQRSSGALNAVS